MVIISFRGWFSLGMHRCCNLVPPVCIAHYETLQHQVAGDVAEMDEQTRKRSGLVASVGEGIRVMRTIK